MKARYAVLASAYVVAVICLNAKENESTKLDPAAWGSDHVGKPMPEYVTGDECLFCHRKDFGEKWQTNRHQTTIRASTSEQTEVEGEAALVMGHETMMRFLRRAKAYGKLEIHTHGWDPGAKKRVPHGAANWDARTFGNRCAGCHTTGVDAKTTAFSSLSIDCYACHGDVDLRHTDDTSKILLSKARKDPARVVISICAQCHIRTGKSRSTGRPYPNNFVPGDNLFRDFELSFAEKDIANLNPVDRHVIHNVRDVVGLGKSDMTCLTCHHVHKGSSERHERLDKKAAICATCHETKDGEWITKEYEVHSKLCEY